MSKYVTLENIEENLTFFHTMYDVVRLVDPVQKCVLEYGQCKISMDQEKCFNYWQNGKICDNCISVKAYHDDKSYMKLEYIPEMIMMVIAIPLGEDDSPVILELLKNVTDSIWVGKGNYNDYGYPLKSIVSEFNDRVVRDNLTNLYNRGFIDDRLPVDIVRATVSNEPLSVIFLDMDQLKKINDLYGHTVGDIAIKEAGKAIANSIRNDNDWAARYGGDEFFICLNNTDYDEAYKIAERIRKNIEKISVTDENIHFSASLGIYTMRGTRHTAEELINIVDKKMYEVKESRKDYADSLLNMSVKKSLIAPLAFGEGDVKERVNNVLKYKKRKTWLIILLAVIVAGIIIALSVNGTNKDTYTYESSKLGYKLELPNEWKDKALVSGIPDEWGNGVQVNDENVELFFVKKTDGSRGGHLFSINREIGELITEEDIKQSPIPSKLLLHANGYTYYATFPSDVQYNPEEKEETENYMSMNSKAEEILKSIEPYSDEKPASSNEGLL